MNDQGQLDTRDRYMTAMADEVVWAWRDNRPLILAKLVKNDCGRGIFVPSRPHCLPRKVFWSWHFTSDGSSDGTLEPVDKHVELDVSSEVDPSGQVLLQLQSNDGYMGCASRSSSPTRSALPLAPVLRDGR